MPQFDSSITDQNQVVRLPSDLAFIPDRQGSYDIASSPFLPPKSGLTITTYNGPTGRSINQPYFTTYYEDSLTLSTTSQTVCSFNFNKYCESTGNNLLRNCFAARINLVIKENYGFPTYAPYNLIRDIVITRTSTNNYNVQSFDLSALHVTQNDSTPSYTFTNSYDSSTFEFTLSVASANTISNVNVSSLIYVNT